MEQVQELRDENQVLRQELEEVEEKQERTEGQVYQNTVMADRTLERVITVETLVHPIQTDLRSLQNEVTENQATLHRIEQMLRTMTGGGGQQQPAGGAQHPQGHTSTPTGGFSQQRNTPTPMTPDPASMDSDL